MMSANFVIRSTPLQPLRPRSEALHPLPAFRFALIRSSSGSASAVPNLYTASRIKLLRCHTGRCGHRPEDANDIEEGFEFGQRGSEEKERVVSTLLIDNYDSYTYNIYQELSIVNGLPPVVIRNDEWTMDQIRYLLYEERAFDNIVISPGPGSPACPKDIGVCLQILRECEDIPILGVCLGHQALGFVHGAQIVHAPEPVHGRLSEIEHNGGNFFSNIPSGENSGFKVVRYHSLVIDADSLPKELIPVAWTSSTGAGSSIVSDVEDLDRRKILMGVMHFIRPHYGVQFHPESVATHHGRQIFENFKKMTIKHGLRSRLHQEREVSYACQSSKVFLESKLSYRKAAMQHQLYICNNPPLRPKCSNGTYLKLQWKKIDGLVNSIGGSEKIFSDLFGKKNAENTFWLDSSSTDQGRARFSFMGGKGGPLWKQLTYRLANESEPIPGAGGYLTIQDGNGCTKTKFLSDGLFDFLNKELNSFHYDKEDYEGLPFDFCGGFVGFFGYNLKIECGAAYNRYRSTTPDACFFFADSLIVVDHSNGDVYILSIYNIYRPILKGQQDISNDCAWLDETERRLLKLKATDTQKLKMVALTSPYISPQKSFSIEKSRQQYIRDVEKCLKLIRDGESYELCLTTKMRKRIDGINYLNLYLDLREKNPAPYAAWMNFAEEDLCICCSSPERFLRLDGNDKLEAKPIKGTVARGRTPEEDEHFKLQLQFSEKDQAENLMIVDLLRNDLGRVCEPGTVCVPRLMEVESYATVHTMVSTIQGKKSSTVSPIDCVRAAFPGGSMTGAPKLRSMEILDSLENSARGIYSGSIGFLSYNQTFDLNIVIRTVVIHEGEASVGAGGAIVALSNPEEEYEEMMLKAKAPTRAVNEQTSSLDYVSRTFNMAM